MHCAYRGVSEGRKGIRTVGSRTQELIAARYFGWPQSTMSRIKGRFAMRTLVVALLATAVGTFGMVSGGEKTGTKDGIHGYIKAVDVAKKTLTVITSDGKEKIFEISKETVMVGPRGGAIRRHLKDPRFHEGFPITVMAKGADANEIHLGYAKDAKTGKLSKEDAAKLKERLKAAKEIEEKDDVDLLGHVKSFDSTKRMLVVSLVNGKNKSFLLSKDTPVKVKGAVSKRGIMDPAISSGAAVIVVTDADMRKVKEIRISQAKAKKAG
jgi:hypothetical protein